MLKYMNSFRISIFALACSITACSNGVPANPPATIPMGGYRVTAPSAGVAKSSETIARQKAVLSVQEEELARQKREMEDLERERHENDKIRKYAE